MSDFEIMAADAAGNLVDISAIAQIQKASSQAKDDEGIETEKSHPYDLKALANMFEENTWHYRCCKAKAQIVAGEIEITPKSGIEPDNKAYLDQKKNLESLIETCNENDESLYDVLEKFWTDYEAFGNAYLEIVADEKGFVREVYSVPAYTIKKVYPNRNDSKFYFIQRRDSGGVARFNSRNYDKIMAGDVPANMMHHMANYYLKSDYYGMPDFLPALMAASLDGNAMAYNSNFFSNATIPGLLIHTVGNGQLDNGQKADIMRYIRSFGKGVDNAHKTLFISTRKGIELKIEKLFSEIKDSSFQKMREQNRDEIIAAHGVPPRIVGIMSAGNLGGTGEGYAQMKIFERLIVMPRQRRLTSFVNRNIVANVENSDLLRINFSGMDLSDPLEKADRAIRLKQGGVIKTNEAREIVGRDPLEEVNIDALEEIVTAYNEIIEQGEIQEI
jgi:PBSX family phage portal protein